MNMLFANCKQRLLGLLFFCAGNYTLLSLVCVTMGTGAGTGAGGHARGMVREGRQCKYSRHRSHPTPVICEWVRERIALDLLIMSG